MNKLFLLLFILLSQVNFAQLESRKTLRGKIIADSLNVNGMTVYNKTTNRGVVTSVDGYFNIFAKTKDTLVVSSVQVKPVQFILNESDLKTSLLFIYLEAEINELDELVIKPKRFTGNLFKDSKTINTVSTDLKLNSEAISKMLFEKDALSSAENKATYSDGTIPLGANFVEIFKLIAPDIFKKKEKKPTPIERYEKLNAFVKSRYTEYFYTEILKLKLENIDRFLIYCEEDPKLISILKDKNEFLLTELLIEKRKGFSE